MNDEQGAKAGQGSQASPAVADEVLPDTIYLMPVPNRPFFPGQVQPVAINPEEWGETLKAVGRSGSGVVGLAFVPGVAPGDVEQGRSEC